MDEIDKLLSQIKADYQESLKTPKQPETLSIQPKIDLDNLLIEVKEEFSNIQPPAKSLINNSSVIDNILSQVKANYDEQDQARSLNEQQQLQAKQLKQIEMLKLHAQDWLKQLDPLSTEGLWFERFAEGYPTKLEAAINYLQES